MPPPGSPSVGKLGKWIWSSTKRVLVEEVHRKYATSVGLVLIPSSALAYVSCLIKEKNDWDERIRRGKEELQSAKDRYLRDLEPVNAELMKRASQALDK
ncbi:unnamed protein product [Microthlaspi erraticum]|uniref:Uncharacterized protein n=1 Tax=Microthlaspi erraticum TaxID=1685480 RepID=A0A6D2II37_9BRAS|nr:unnamed protein product [Microthlaspi erraticum]